METSKTKNSRQSQSLAEMTKKAELMVKGLKANAEEVAKRGLTSEFSTNMEKSIEDMKTSNAEQEKLKADVKLKTEEFNSKKSEVNKALSEAKKVVKLTFPQAKWIEFGMEDKR